MNTAAPVYVPLTDAEWKAVEHVFSTYVYQRGAPSRFSDRVCLDAILHAMTIGCAFSELPENLGYPKRQALYRRALSMRSSKALPKAIAILRRDGRVLPEEPQVAPEPEDAPAAPCSFGAQVTIEAMQAAARARLVRGLPPDWRDDDV
ncbi:transposase [Burkholderia cenocepacia]|uniref:transposase n=1 Tax=Burkholderia cenocepacia TaxID=95486 RepID=UPI0026524859|nr:transposase [Burkholderia cenocepacia]MDN7456579.1 transposase [Burkholderia cenocepacia]